jgi:uncharacterized protein (UPF0276 family)
MPRKKRKETYSAYLETDLLKELKRLARQKKIKSVSDFLNFAGKKALLDMVTISKENTGALVRICKPRENINDAITRLLKMYHLMKDMEEKNGEKDSAGKR